VKFEAVKVLYVAQLVDGDII